MIYVLLSTDNEYKIKEWGKTYPHQMFTPIQYIHGTTYLNLQFILLNLNQLTYIYFIKLLINKKIDINTRCK